MVSEGSNQRSMSLSLGGEPLRLQSRPHTTPHHTTAKPTPPPDIPPQRDPPSPPSLQSIITSILLRSIPYLHLHGRTVSPYQELQHPSQHLPVLPFSLYVYSAPSRGLICAAPGTTRARQSPTTIQLFHQWPRKPQPSPTRRRNDTSIS